jgi:hypothetical protein
MLLKMELFLLLGEGKLEKLWVSKTCENNGLHFGRLLSHSHFKKGVYIVVYFTKFSVFQNISVHIITGVDGIATLYWLNG